MVAMATGYRFASLEPAWFNHPIRQIFLGSIPNIELEDRVYRLHTRAMGL